MREDAHIACLFPVASGQDEAVRAILRERGAIFYEKFVVYTRNGLHNLIAQLGNDAW